jgi:Na+-transporting methylmalonyl-CoA/oxaloacetate decarboxylase beta subunit
MSVTGSSVMAAVAVLSPPIVRSMTSRRELRAPQAAPEGGRCWGVSLV